MTDCVLDASAVVARARSAACRLAGLTAEQRQTALLAMADELEKSRTEIIEANQADLARAKVDMDAGTMSVSMYNRLKLDWTKLQDLVAGIKQVASLPDPLGKPALARQLDDDLTLYRVPCPIGLILIIFESRPDALPQIISLLIKTGNAGLIKGGKEAVASIEALFKAVNRALGRLDFYPEQAYSLLAGREEVSTMLKMDGSIDLIIPRGSNDLVRQIQDSTRIPVLGHADGICHVYVDKAANLQTALRVVLDSKCQYPSACNSSETLLVHADVAPSFLPLIIGELKSEKVEVRCDQKTIDSIKLQDVMVANEQDWKTEYCDLIISVKVVNDISEAVAHINRYGSRHTESIITEDNEAFESFATAVDSAGVYQNASTRFADGFRYGFGAEVGISTSKLHPRGPVGIEGLVTYKYHLRGNGHIVGDYCGDGARKFKHRDLI